MTLQDRLQMTRLMGQLAIENAQDSCLHIQEAAIQCGTLADRVGLGDLEPEDAEAMLIVLQHYISGLTLPSAHEGSVLEAFLGKYSIPAEAIDPEYNDPEVVNWASLPINVAKFLASLQNCNEIMNEHYASQAMVDRIERATRDRDIDFPFNPEMR